MLRWLLLTVCALCTACDSADEVATPEAGVAPDEWMQRFETKRGALVGAGEHSACGERFRAPEGLPAEWSVVHVDQGAEPGGDGAEATPHQTIEAALADGEGPVVLRVAPGRYEAAVRVERSAALVGSCAAGTVLVGGVRAEGDADRGRDLYVQHLTLEGGGYNLWAADLSRVQVSQARLVDGAEGGVLARRVHTIEVLDSAVRGAGGPQLTFNEAVAFVRRSLVGPGAGMGVLARATDEPAAEVECADAWSPACPYAASLVVEDSLVRDVVTVGIRARNSQTRVRQTRVERVSAEEPGRAVGLDLVESLAVVTDGVVVDGVDGRGILLRSARTFIDDVRVSGNSAGGLDVIRLPPGAVHPPGLRWHPVCEFHPICEFQVAPDAHFEGDEWAPPMDWFAEGPLAEHLPDPLLPGHEGRAEEAALHEWARSDVRRLEALDNGVVGIHLSGHPTRLVGARISGTLGAGSVGLRIDQEEFVPIQSPGASTVALSRVEDVEVVASEGRGMQISNAWLIFDAVAAVKPLSQLDLPLPLAADALHVEGLRVDGSGGVGVMAFRSNLSVSGLTVSDSVAVGVLTEEVVLDATDVRVTDIAGGRVPGPGGADIGEIADGFVIHPPKVEVDEATLRIDGVGVEGAGRIGLYVVNGGDVASGRIARGDGVFARNGRDVVANVAEGGVEFVGFDALVEDDPPAPAVE